MNIAPKSCIKRVKVKPNGVIWSHYEKLLGPLTLQQRSALSLCSMFSLLSDSDSDVSAWMFRLRE